MEEPLSPTGRFTRIEWVATTGSTNTDLANRARAGDTRAAVRIADQQTAGRGRRDRTWEMPAGGGLLISFLVPWTDMTTGHLVPTGLGVAAVDTIGTFGRSVSLKWPNDLVTDDGSKVGGMLSETVTSERQVRAIVCGLGCNISWPTEPVPDIGDATSLDALGGQPIDRRLFARRLIERFDAVIADLRERGSTWLLSEYRTRCATIGREVKVELVEGSIEGRATDVDDRGHLLVEIGGALRSIAVGDVVHLRPSQRAPE